MPRINYQDFDILFAATPIKGEYSAQVFGSSGDSKITFSLSKILEDIAETTTSDENKNLANRNFTLVPTINILLDFQSKDPVKVDKAVGLLKEKTQNNELPKEYKEQLISVLEIKKGDSKDQAVFIDAPE